MIIILVTLISSPGGWYLEELSTDRLLGVSQWRSWIYTLLLGLVPAMWLVGSRDMSMLRILTSWCSYSPVMSSAFESLPESFLFCRRCSYVCVFLVWFDKLEVNTYFLFWLYSVFCKGVLWNIECFTRCLISWAHPEIFKVFFFVVAFSSILNVFRL